jgi:hypothetical protein
VYFALRKAGYSNRVIADLLDVDEASVRRGLKARPDEAVQSPTVLHVNGLRITIE